MRTNEWFLLQINESKLQLAGINEKSILLTCYKMNIRQQRNCLSVWINLYVHLIYLNKF